MKQQPTNSGSCVGTSATKEPATTTSPVRITLPCAEIEITPLRKPSEKCNTYPYLKESESVTDTQNVAIAETDSAKSQRSVDLQELNKPGYTKTFVAEKFYKAGQWFCPLYTFYFFYSSGYIVSRAAGLTGWDDCYLQAPFLIFSGAFLLGSMLIFPMMFLRPLIKKDDSDASQKANLRGIARAFFYFIFLYGGCPALLYATLTYQLEPTIVTICATTLAIPYCIEMV